MIQIEEDRFLNSPSVFEKVGPTISKYVSSTRACAWGDIVPLTHATNIVPLRTVPINMREKQILARAIEIQKGKLVVTRIIWEIIRQQLF